MGEPRIQTRVVDGLAVHERGEGMPVMVMPYSHAFTSSPMTESALAQLVERAGRRVVTYDPPGAYLSTRTPTMAVAEMVECAIESLDACGVTGPVDIVGHSTGGLCATALSLSHPDRVRGLFLVAPTGVGDRSRLRALPFGMRDPRFWRFCRDALPVYGGRGSAAQLRRLYDLLLPALYRDPSACAPLDLGGRHSDDGPAPPRAALLRRVPDMRRAELSTIGAATHLVVGAADPIFPAELARKIASWIPRSSLSVIDGCGHYPAEETPDAIAAALAAFFEREDSGDPAA